MLLLAFIAFSIAVYAFIFFIVKKDHGRKEPTSMLFAAAGFGLLAVILAGTLNELLLPDEFLAFKDGKSERMLPFTTLMLSTLSIGVIEETLKAIPLAIFIYKKRYFDELTDGIIYFGIAALTFGIIEDILYTLDGGGGVGLARILLSPYLHVGFTVLFGSLLIRKKLINGSWFTVALGLLAAIVIHGLYNFSVFSSSVLGSFGALGITVTLNILVFVLFKRAQDSDEDHSLSATGVNKFCRACGRPNPTRLLYCSTCGHLS